MSASRARVTDRTAAVLRPAEEEDRSVSEGTSFLGMDSFPKLTLLEEVELAQSAEFRVTTNIAAISSRPLATAEEDASSSIASTAAALSSSAEQWMDYFSTSVLPTATASLSAASSSQSHNRRTNGGGVSATVHSFSLKHELMMAQSAHKLLPTLSLARHSSHSGSVDTRLSLFQRIFGAKDKVGDSATDEKRKDHSGTSEHLEERKLVQQCYDSIPARFLLPPAEFDAFGDIGRMDNSRRQIANEQKQLSTYLDSVEVNLLRLLCSKSQFFMSRLSNIRDLQREVKSVVRVISALRVELKTIDDALFEECTLQVFAAFVRRRNVLLALRYVEFIHDITSDVLVRTDHIIRHHCFYTGVVFQQQTTTGDSMADASIASAIGIKQLPADFQPVLDDCTQSLSRLLALMQSKDESSRVLSLNCIPSLLHRIATDCSKLKHCIVFDTYALLKSLAIASVRKKCDTTGSSALLASIAERHSELLSMTYSTTTAAVTVSSSDTLLTHLCESWVTVECSITGSLLTLCQALSALSQDSDDSPATTPRPMESDHKRSAATVSYADIVAGKKQKKKTAPKKLLENGRIIADSGKTQRSHSTRYSGSRRQRRRQRHRTKAARSSVKRAVPPTTAVKKDEECSSIGEGGNESSFDSECMISAVEAASKAMAEESYSKLSTELKSAPSILRLLLCRMAFGFTLDLLKLLTSEMGLSISAAFSHPSTVAADDTLNGAILVMYCCVEEVALISQWTGLSMSPTASPSVLEADDFKSMKPPMTSSFSKSLTTDVNNLEKWTKLISVTTAHGKKSRKRGVRHALAQRLRALSSNEAYLQWLERIAAVCQSQVSDMLSAIVSQLKQACATLSVLSTHGTADSSSKVHTATANIETVVGSNSREAITAFCRHVLASYWAVVELRSDVNCATLSTVQFKSLVAKTLALTVRCERVCGETFYDIREKTLTEMRKFLKELDRKCTARMHCALVADNWVSAKIPLRIQAIIDDMQQSHKLLDSSGVAAVGSALLSSTSARRDSVSRKRKLGKLELIYRREETEESYLKDVELEVETESAISATSSSGAKSIVQATEQLLDEKQFANGDGGEDDAEKEDDSVNEIKEEDSVERVDDCVIADICEVPSSVLCTTTAVTVLSVVSIMDFKSTASGICAIEVVYDYCQLCARLQPICYEIGLALCRVLQYFNDKVCDLILGAGAMQTAAALKSISAKHLCLAHRIIHLLLLLISDEPIVTVDLAALSTIDSGEVKRKSIISSDVFMSLSERMPSVSTLPLPQSSSSRSLAAATEKKETDASAGVCRSNGRELDDGSILSFFPILEGRRCEERRKRERCEEVDASLDTAATGSSSSSTMAQRRSQRKKALAEAKSAVGTKADLLFGEFAKVKGNLKLHLRRIEAKLGSIMQQLIEACMNKLERALLQPIYELRRQRAAAASSSAKSKKSAAIGSVVGAGYKTHASVKEVMKQCRNMHKVLNEYLPPSVMESIFADISLSFVACLKMILVKLKSSQSEMRELEAMDESTLAVFRRSQAVLEQSSRFVADKLTRLDACDSVEHFLSRVFGKTDSAHSSKSSL